MKSTLSITNYAGIQNHTVLCAIEHAIAAGLQLNYEPAYSPAGPGPKRATGLTLNDALAILEQLTARPGLANRYHNTDHPAVAIQYAVDAEAVEQLGDVFDVHGQMPHPPLIEDAEDLEELLDALETLDESLWDRDLPLPVFGGDIYAGPIKNAQSFDAKRLLTGKTIEDLEIVYRFSYVIQSRATYEYWVEDSDQLLGLWHPQVEAATVYGDLNDLPCHIKTTLGGHFLAEFRNKAG